MYQRRPKLSVNSLMKNPNFSRLTAIFSNRSQAIRLKSAFINLSYCEDHGRAIKPFLLGLFSERAVGPIKLNLKLISRYGWTIIYICKYQKDSERLRVSLCYLTVNTCRGFKSLLRYHTSESFKRLPGFDHRRRFLRLSVLMRWLFKQR